MLSFFVRPLMALSSCLLVLLGWNMACNMGLTGLTGPSDLELYDVRSSCNAPASTCCLHLVHQAKHAASPACLGPLFAHRFGDTVNTASRMESNGVPGRIHISQATYGLLPASMQESEWEMRGEIEVKGKGKMTTFLSKEEALRQAT